MKPLPVITPEKAASLVQNGDTLLCGGFGMTGNPVHLVHALAKTNVKDLTYIANNVSEPGLGAGRLLNNGQLRKIIGAYFTSNPDAVTAIMEGKVEYELIPQGTLAEAIRAGGMGIGGFFTPTGAGTLMASDKETRFIQNREHVFIPGIRGNIAFVRAWKADQAGNLVYRLTERNFNMLVATAADIVIAEVEEIVPVGQIDPDHVHTPGCFIDYLVEAKINISDLGSSAFVAGSSKKVDETRWRIAARALKELHPGEIINLGIGLPTLIADLIKPEHQLLIHTENGMLGVGPEPADGMGAMTYPVNAGKIPVTALPGASYFDSATSHGLIRGGHIDVAVMGAFQVDASGNLANWSIPGFPLMGVGGAMDLATGAKRVIITMLHTDKTGNSKIVEACTMPLTASQVVDMIITDLGVFKITAKGLVLVELMPGADLEKVKAHTDATYQIAL